MNERWRDLWLASADVLAANCRLHRERATARLRKAHERIALTTGTEGDEIPIQFRLAAYIEDYEGDDPEADRLIAECREAGLLTP